MAKVIRGILPRSLLGQMLLAVAVALFVAQGISAVLLYRASEQRREMGYANNLAFQLVAQPEIDIRQNARHGRGLESRRLRVERTTDNPLRPGESRDKRREQQLRAVLTEQGVVPAQLVVTRRKVTDDAYVMGRLRDRPDLRSRPEWTQGEFIVAGLLRPGEVEWTVARVPLVDSQPRQLGTLIMQTLLLYVVLVGLLALLLRRITEPLAALTRRLERFAETREIDGQIEPSGPKDTRRLIEAHNAMEARIAALLDEKDVMLGAIGHDLKTPLAALRVRIETVPDDAEREKMARTIEDIANTLDDILSLARVGRSTDPLEPTDLAALVASVVEEFEDMDEPVTLGASERIALPLRATWLRRALRNLIGNALRYGERATVSLRRDGGDAVIRIEDEGPGIPRGDLTRMMEPFTRGEGSRNRATGGAGLGLAIARAIAEQHGGRLVLANRPAGGLEVELRLPTKR
uniref:sensor histidine kinase n=1 Tax=Altererythrobacter segetis TaxID=1104773 RepID=UPI001FAEE5AF|nr:ATP-binding protein [Altererythrobacter segetis]